MFFRCIPRNEMNYTWAELMRRVFELDMLEYLRRLGRIRIVGDASPYAIRRILDFLGLPSRAPPLAPDNHIRSPHLLFGEEVADGSVLAYLRGTVNKERQNNQCDSPEPWRSKIPRGLKENELQKVPST
jgi:hypothetical protein